jgi:crotonobetainyl-CoA:carnitine CoA-transferase CaiB-like acyl-CoA transferase
VRVLDFARVLAGPWAAQILGDLGAQVTKIERPGIGDDSRTFGPPYLRDREGRATGDAVYFLSANRNKRSITIDFTKPEGQALVRRLAAGSDILIENYKTGGLRQYGLDYPSLREVNPRLIYCSITGYGQTGPYAGRPGYDVMIQAVSGLMSMTGRGDGEPGAGPVKVGASVSDLISGTWTVISVLAALAHRERTGLGQHIDLSLVDAQVASLANQGMMYLYTGVEPKRMGNLHPNIVPYQDFRTADGWMILAIANDGQFARFSEVVGNPDWASDPRFVTNAARVAHRDVLVPRVAEALGARRTGEWIELLESVDVPCGPINGLQAVFDNPQARVRGLRVTVQHPVAGEIPMIANPIKFSETPVQYRRAPPLLGEHTREILGELGVDEAEISKLVESGVVTLAPSPSR